MGNIGELSCSEIVLATDVDISPREAEIFDMKNKSHRIIKELDNILLTMAMLWPRMLQSYRGCVSDQWLAVLPVVILYDIVTRQCR